MDIVLGGDLIGSSFSLGRRGSMNVVILWVWSIKKTYKNERSHDCNITLTRPCLFNFFSHPSGKSLSSLANLFNALINCRLC